MRKIFESPRNGWDESATKVYVYALDDEDEYWMLEDMNAEELEEYFGVSSEHWAMPGAAYTTYDFHLQGDHIVMYETYSLNV